MINRKYIYLILCSLIFMFLSFFINVKTGKSISGPCSECHTMHNSQDNASMSYCATWSLGPFRALTRGDCAICHTGSNYDLGNTTHVPHVNSYSEPGYRFNGTTLTGDSNNPALAGGSFYWAGIGNCTSSNATGYVCVHDVDFFISIGKADTGPFYPPGYEQNYGNRGRGHSWDKQLTCAGTYGCHGDPQESDPFAAISGAHHKNVRRDNGNATPNDVYDSYRFLLGIKGFEDDDWEYTLSENDHNGYYAAAYTSTFTTPSDEASINYLCGECHGKFHYETNSSSSYASPWLRHPTDIDMNQYKGTNKEYQNYPGPFDSNGTYFPYVPVGTDDGSRVNYVWNDGDAIVLCISCHRAHGSPYADLLRWPYYTCTCGNSTNSTTKCGCFACHTKK